jgi:hypothetical protein
MTDAYTATLNTTSAAWIAAINGATANKLIAAGAYKQHEKTVWYTVIAA